MTFKIAGGLLSVVFWLFTCREAKNLNDKWQKSQQNGAWRIQLAVLAAQF
jgi:hypothetical protein